MSEELSPAKRLAEYFRKEDTVESIRKVTAGYLVPETVASFALQNIRKNNELLSCDPITLLEAVRTLAQMGCMPDGIHGYLVPFWDKNTGKRLCTPVPAARGLVRMAQDNGIRSIQFDIVHKNDDFAWSINNGQLQMSHTPELWTNSEPIGAYCTWRDKDGTMHGVVMTKAEIDKVRNGSRAKNAKPWTEFYDQMALKTVVRRASKQWALPYAICEAMQRADDMEFSEPRNITPEHKGDKSPSFIEIEPEKGEQENA